MSDSSNASGYQGAETAHSASTSFNSLHFLAQQVVNKVSTATLVKIVKVSNEPGHLGPIGTVDVLPLVNQVDGWGNATKHQTIHKLSYNRYHGGRNAVIIDPEVGDIGLAVFADRDISSVKAKQDQANPGSMRRFDMADGIYTGRTLQKEGENPEQYIRFFKTGGNQGVQIRDKNGNDFLLNQDGVTITDKSGNRIVMSSAGISFNP